jgi:hypothetical protein
MANKNRTVCKATVIPSLEAPIESLCSVLGKKSTPPPTYDGWNTSPPTYENEFYPLNFLKQHKSASKAVLKNHNKSQNIIK